MKKCLLCTLLYSVFFLFACTPAEKPDASSVRGVTGTLPEFVSDDDPATKAKFPVAEMNLRFEVGDRINIWSEVGTLLVYKVTVTDGKSATFDGGGFTLTEGMTYYSSFPLIANPRDDFNALTHSYEGQVQTADGVADHVAEYTYVYSSSTCTNGLTHFAYHHLSSWIRFFLTVPKTMTVTELQLIADSPVFALDGKVNMSVDPATFTPVTMSDTITLGLDSFSVTDGELNAYVAVNPFDACNVVVKIKTADGRVYTSTSLAQNALAVGKYRTIRTELAEENPFNYWEKVTSTDQLTSGKYALVYPDGATYKLFSFEKTMVNAQAAAALVADKHTFGEVVPMRGQLFQTLVNDNYQTVSAPEDPATLKIPVEIEDEVGIQATTELGETGNGSVLLKSSFHNLNAPTVVVALGPNSEAPITAAFDPTDFKAICNQLRGHELKFSFQDVMDFVASEIGMSASAKASALNAFDKICVAAKEECAEHGYDLGDIDRSTRLMDVYENHYFYFADKSLGYDSDKAYGWIKPIGFYVQDNGFSAHVPVPSSEWFNRLKASFSYGEGGKAGFIAYWQKVDTEFPRIAQAFGTASFFGRLAQKVMATTTDEQFNTLAGINWTAVGQKYQRYADDLNTDELSDIYLYKLVEE